jgi:hypothetical protein
MSQIRPVYSARDKRDAQNIAGVVIHALNFGPKRAEPQRTELCELGPIVKDLNDLATGTAVGYNEFIDQEEKKRFQKHWGNDYSLVLDGRIFASDRKDVPELAVTRLNGRLEKYLYRPEIQYFSKGKLNVNWETTSAIGSFVHLILELAERGLLARVRVCERCGNWFYAKQDRTRFCRKMCAKLHWQSSETAKAKRRKYNRKYMRKYRKKHS